MKKRKHKHVRKILHPSRKVRKPVKVIQARTKRRGRAPSKVNSKGQDKRRAKKRVLHKHHKAVVKPKSYRKRKGVKTTRLPVKVQKVSRGKKQLRKLKGGNKRVPKKPVRKVLRKTRVLRRPSNYNAFNDDQGLKKLYRIDLRQRTYKEKVAYITRFNFWPMIEEAENLYDNQFPFGFMVIIETRYKGDTMLNADKLSPIEEAIDDPAVRRHSLSAMERFKTLRPNDPRANDNDYKQLFKPVNIKALIIRFFYRTPK